MRTTAAVAAGIPRAFCSAVHAATARRRDAGSGRSTGSSTNIADARLPTWARPVTESGVLLETGTMALSTTPSTGSPRSVRKRR
nr:hypothetical protein [Terrabacter tumescens]